MVDADIIHPSTPLRRLIGDNKDLIGCKEDPEAWKPCFTSGYFYTMYDEGWLQNFWTTASEAFVKSISQKKLSCIVVALSKGLSEGDERRLHNSIFWKYELRSISSEVSLSHDKCPGLRAEDDDCVEQCVDMEAGLWQVTVDYAKKHASERPCRPQLLVVDMRGICHQVRPLIEERIEDDPRHS
ncbi:unnamed protein product [Symbiodinium sp. CCMP2456]|nr:unnamed protein product [Symbiodinium sp. CCMP2456]